MIIAPAFVRLVTPCRSPIYLAHQATIGRRRCEGLFVDGIVAMASRISILRVFTFHEQAVPVNPPTPESRAIIHKIGPVLMIAVIPYVWLILITVHTWFIRIIRLTKGSLCLSGSDLTSEMINLPRCRLPYLARRPSPSLPRSDWQPNPLPSIHLGLSSSTADVDLLVSFTPRNNTTVSSAGLTEDSSYCFIGLAIQLGHSIRHVALQIPVCSLWLDVEQVLNYQQCTRREGAN